GIGLAIALRAARDGANVAIAAKTAEPHPKLKGTIYTAAEEVRAAGGKALPILCDIREEAQVMAAIDGARKLKLVVLDACRDNPFANASASASPAPNAVAANPSNDGTRNARTRSLGKGLGELKVQGASLVVYAAKHGQTALDGEGENSPFAVAVVQRIATPGVEINKLFRLVRDDVMEATAGRQEPYTYGSLPGREDFFFVNK
ncbi:MAG: SDR family NAD(P)-dependent oxidoreductase, partial [Bradyrhizobium sp.]|nr:SDR family NAD(P)-dependent oxidoreductase [Bradyrhizobium sp.]